MDGWFLKQLWGLVGKIRNIKVKEDGRKDPVKGLTNQKSKTRDFVLAMAGGYLAFQLVYKVTDVS